VHAASFLRGRCVVLDSALLRRPRELRRILIHELFHFVWLRAGNRSRLEYERLVRHEHSSGARGELGWSAEWRKDALRALDRSTRTRRWREYVCESFCDTAAWLYSTGVRHPEFTLAARYRSRRREWFLGFLALRPELLF
jgi:hypothetical protein